MSIIDNQINALPENAIPPPISLHRNRGDGVNHVETMHIGCEITHPNAYRVVYDHYIDDYPMPAAYDEQFIHPREFNKSMHLHAVRPLDAEREYHVDIYKGSMECDRILHSKRKVILEDTRQKWGVNVMSFVISTISSIMDFIFRLLGIEFFRRNLHKSDDTGESN